MAEFLLSVLTPTYNRANTLHRAFDSLVAQDAKNFEWIVVDDGSEDDTRSLIRDFGDRADFPLQYHHKKNGGKASAVNLGMTHALGKYVIVLDSDDELLPGATAEIEKWAEKVRFDQHAEVSELHFLAVDDFGQQIGPDFPGELTICDHRDMTFRYRRSGEHAVVFKSRILRDFPMVEIAPPEHVPESVTWNRIAESYRAICVNVPIRRYYQHDGIERLSTDTAKDRKDRGSEIRWPTGKYLWALSSLNHETPWFRYNPNYFFKRARNMVRYGLHAGCPLARQWSELRTIAGKLLWLLCLWPGIVRYRQDVRNTAS